MTIAASSRLMITEAERRFPARIRIGVPPEGLGRQLTDMMAWLDANCGVLRAAFDCATTRRANGFPPSRTGNIRRPRGDPRSAVTGSRLAPAAVTPRN